MAGIDAACIVAQFLEDVDQRSRRPDAASHGKTESVCLSLAVIGVLTQKQDTYPLEWRECKRPKYLVLRRINFAPGALLRHERQEVIECRFRDFRTQGRTPIRRERSRPCGTCGTIVKQGARHNSVFPPVASLPLARFRGTLGWGKFNDFAGRFHGSEQWQHATEARNADDSAAGWS